MDFMKVYENWLNSPALSADEKAELEASLSDGSLPYDRIQAASERIGQIIEETDEKEFRLLELYEMQ